MGCVDQSGPDVGYQVGWQNLLVVVKNEDQVASDKFAPVLVEPVFLQIGFPQSIAIVGFIRVLIFQDPS